MNITEHEVSALLRVLLRDWPDLVFDGEPDIQWASDIDKNGEVLKYIDRFVSLRVKLA